MTTTTFVAYPAVAAEGSVLFITLHFPPSRDIGAHACEQIARYLPLYGYEPIVLTRPKRLFESIDPDHARPFPGRIIEAAPLPHPLALYRSAKVGRGKWRAQSSSADDIRREPGRLRRWILSLLYTPDTYTGWIIPATFAGLRAIRRYRITHIVSSGPYWTNHLVGWLLSTITRVAWTAHYRDPWNQIPPAKPVSQLSSAIDRVLERLVVRRAASVVCVTESHATLLRELFTDLPPAKFTAIPNGFDEGEWASVEPAAEGERDQFVIRYTGGFMMGTRSPRPLFRAIRDLIDRRELDGGEIRIEFYGYCSVAERMPLTRMVAQYGLDAMVRVAPPVTRVEALRLMASADLLLLLAEDWTMQIPGKTYEYLRAGRPILALTPEGALSDLLRRTGGARICERDDCAAVAAAVRDAYDAWKNRTHLPAADPAIVASFDRRQLAGRFAALFS